jgi:DNA-binding transcriptional MerR regulator
MVVMVNIGGTVQLNFLQEELLAVLQESKKAAAPKGKMADNSSPDLFGGLPLAMPPEKDEKPQEKPVKKSAKKVAGKPAEKISEPAQDKVEHRKAPTAFKTISEASALLNVPQHVLRFWESRFSQIKPLKMGGGRRYYRPEDIDILSKIQNLLYKQGYTIKGAKKAFEAKDFKKTNFENITNINQDVILTDKQKKQVSAIRQELLNLRETLRPYLSETIAA